MWKEWADNVGVVVVVIFSSTGVYFILSPSTAALSHRKPASTEISPDMPCWGTGQKGHNYPSPCVERNVLMTWTSLIRSMSADQVKSMRYWESWRWEVTLIFRRHKVAAALCIFHCMAKKYLLSLLRAQGSGCKGGRRNKRKASIVEPVGTIFAVRCGKWRCGWNVFTGRYIRLHNPDC
jgi:hypothetical protein